MIDLIIPLIPLFSIIIIIAFIVFYQQISKEKRLEELYDRYGEKAQVAILHSNYSILSNKHSHNYFFTVSLIDKHGKNHIYNISTGNNAAKKYLNCNQMEVVGLVNIFSEYESIVAYAKENSRNNKEFRENIHLYNMPLMVIPEDRSFRKNGTHKRISFCVILLFLLSFITAYIAMIENEIISGKLITEIAVYLVPIISIIIVLLSIISLIISNKNIKK